jgi:hypothetical protein
MKLFQKFGFRETGRKHVQFSVDFKENEDFKRFFQELVPILIYEGNVI